LRTVSLQLRVVAGLATVLAVLIAGCPPRATPTDTTPPASPPAEPATAPTEAPAAPTSEFAWTDTPTLDGVPDAPVRGMINGKAFTANTIRIEKGDDGQSTLEVSDATLEDPTGIATDDTGVDLDFTLPEGQAGDMVKTVADEKVFEKEHAYYHYPQGGDKGPMSVNVGWGCALKIDAWDMTPDPANERILGKVTGKVAIVFDDDPKSWVAGTFEAPYYKW
jgi:hypothetical protein